MPREKIRMTMTTKKYKSPSTPEVSHDLSNFLVEALLINRYGVLPEAGWRKGKPLAKEWSRLLTCIRRIKNTLGVELEQLAWYVQFYKVTDLDYKDFGLLRWKVKRYFKWCNLDRFTNYYTKLHEHSVGESNDYAEKATGYKTKEVQPSKTRTLSDILQELEQNDG